MTQTVVFNLKWNNYYKKIKISELSLMYKNYTFTLSLTQQNQKRFVFCNVVSQMGVTTKVLKLHEENLSYII